MSLPPPRSLPPSLAPSLPPSLPRSLAPSLPLQDRLTDGVLFCTYTLLTSDRDVGKRIDQVASNGQYVISNQY